MSFGLVWFEFGDYSQVGGNAVGWFVGVADESHGFPPRVRVWETALGESANFEGRGVFPGGGVGAAKEGRIFEGCAGGRVNNGEVERRRGSGRKGWVPMVESVNFEVAFAQAVASRPGGWAGCSPVVPQVAELTTARLRDGAGSVVGNRRLGNRRGRSAVATAQLT